MSVVEALYDVGKQLARIARSLEDREGVITRAEPREDRDRIARIERTLDAMFRFPYDGTSVEGRIDRATAEWEQQP